MKTIMILMDSLNRHYLNIYGYEGIRTPNIERLAKKGVVFENHYAGSLPCMPARREILTGRYNFLESPWCPLEPYDERLTEELRKQSGIYSHMISDHYHYWEANGANYNTAFDTWEFIRGQEGDPWYPQAGFAEKPGYRERLRRQDVINRNHIDIENDEDYPTPQCFMRAIDFLNENGNRDNWFLHLEVFDPHEPFACPRKYLDMYDDDWKKEPFCWPEYQPVDNEKEGEEAIRHIRKCYAGTLTMADTWLGKLLDRMDEMDLWKDTSVILTTDHGYLLGEHGYWAKNYMFDYNELVHIPLIVYSPNAPMNGGRVDGLTATIDLMPTILELNGAKPSENVQGRSFLHLLRQNGAHHDAVLYGYFGKDINITDGRYTYCRQPLPGSTTDRFTALAPEYIFKPGCNDRVETGCFLKRVNAPVYKITTESSRHHNAPDYNPVFDLERDPGQLNPLRNEALEAKYALKLKELLKRYDAPECQFVRTGLL